jgi:hypothetical protein
MLAYYPVGEGNRLGGMLLVPSRAFAGPSPALPLCTPDPLQTSMELAQLRLAKSATRLMEQTEDMKEDDYKDRHARQPENNVAKHRATPLSSPGAPAIRRIRTMLEYPLALDRRPPSCTKREV